MAAREERAAEPGTNHTALSDVHVHLVCLDLGSFWITEGGEGAEGSRGKSSQVMEERAEPNPWTGLISATHIC